MGPANINLALRVVPVCKFHGSAIKGPQARPWQVGHRVSVRIGRTHPETTGAPEDTLLLPRNATMRGAAIIAGAYQLQAMNKLFIVPQSVSKKLEEELN